MTLTDLVPSLEVCQQLKEAGFPQDTVFSWAKTPDDWGKEHWHLVSTYLATESDADRRWNDRMVKYSDGVAAPIVEEILKELPWTLQPWLPNIHPVFLQTRKTPDGFRVAWLTWDNKHEVPCDDDDKHCEKESEAAAAAYLWWRKEKT